MELPIILEKVTYQKDNFCIVTANLDRFSKKYKIEMEEQIKDALNNKYNTFTVKINNLMAPIDDSVGGQYIIVGEWEYDPKRGKQFKSEFYYLDIPCTEDGLKAFLMSLPNIKEVRSQYIINKFGIEGTINILDNDPSQLIEISGITEKRIPEIKKSWDEKRYLCRFYQWLIDYNVSIGIADKAYRIWGDKSIKILEDNPYKLTEIRGIGFLTADRIAHQILKDIPIEERVKACMTYVLDDEMKSESNLCMPYNKLKEKILKTLMQCDENLHIEHKSKEYLESIPSCIKNNLNCFCAFKDLEEKPTIVYIYLRRILQMERIISKEIYKRNNNKFEISKELETIIEKRINR